MRDGWLDVLSKMSVEERTAYADRVEDALSRGGYFRPPPLRP